MGDNHTRGPHGQPRGHDLFAWGGRELAKTIQSAAYLDEGPLASMVEQERVAEPARACLMAREVTCLLGGYVKESFVSRGAVPASGLRTRAMSGATGALPGGRRVIHSLNITSGVCDTQASLAHSVVKLGAVGKHTFDSGRPQISTAATASREGVVGIGLSGNHPQAR